MAVQASRRSISENIEPCDASGKGKMDSYSVIRKKREHPSILIMETFEGVPEAGAPNDIKAEHLLDFSGTRDSKSLDLDFDLTAYAKPCGPSTGSTSLSRRFLKRNVRTRQQDAH